MQSYRTFKKPIREHHQGFATLIAFAMLPLSGFATDIYLPSLPEMAATLRVSNIDVQLTLTIFLVSFGITQLFVGTLVDSYGRFRVSVLCLILFSAASLVIANTHNIVIIYMMRVIHGMTVGGNIVAKRAYFIDLFTGNKLKKYLSMFSIIWSTGAIIAPFAGGYLESSFGWKSNFYFLAILSAILAVLEFIFSGETLTKFSPFKLKEIAGKYADMITTLDYTAGLVLLGISYAMVMVYNMTAPFIIEHHLKLSPVITGYSSLIMGLAWMTGGFIGKSTIHISFSKRILYNLCLQIILVVTMLVSAAYTSNIYTLVCFAFLVHSSAGLTFNMFFTHCLSRFPENAGIASGLSGGVNYVIISILSYGVVYILPARDMINLGFSYAMLLALAVALTLMLKIRKELPA